MRWHDATARANAAATMNGEPANAPKQPESAAPARPAPGLLAWLPWLAAVGFAMAAGVLGQAYFAARSEMAALREQAALTEIEKQGLQQQLEAEGILAARRAQAGPAGISERLRIVQLVAPPGTQPTGQAVVVWDAAGQQGELAAFGLPALPADQRYRICIVDPQYADPICAATFTAETPSGRTRIRLTPARPIANAARFVVSTGSAASEPQASDTVILSGE